MKLPLKTSPVLRRSLLAGVFLLAVWGVVRNQVWPRLERDWLSTGFSRYSGLAGGPPPLGCAPHREVVLMRTAMHPWAGVVVFGLGAVLPALWPRRRSARLRAVS